MIFIFTVLALLAGLAPAAAAAATAPAAAAFKCTVPQPPAIRINLVTDPVDYDFSEDSHQLSAMKTDTVNPYAPGTDTATGGLRADHPETSINIKWGSLLYKAQNALCLWYEGVDITVALHPKIYLAKDFDNETCRRAILEHEMKHIEIDHEVINDYGQYMGDAIRETIDQAGAMGPYRPAERKDIEKFLTDRVMNTLHEQTAILDGKMSARQGEIDTLAEYDRISKICDEARNWP